MKVPCSNEQAQGLSQLPCDQPSTDLKTKNPGAAAPCFGVELMRMSPGFRALCPLFLLPPPQNKTPHTQKPWIIDVWIKWWHLADIVSPGDPPAQPQTCVCRSSPSAEGQLYWLPADRGCNKAEFPVPLVTSHFVEATERGDSGASERLLLYIKGVQPSPGRGPCYPPVDHQRQRPKPVSVPSQPKCCAHSGERARNFSLCLPLSSLPPATPLLPTATIEAHFPPVCTKASTFGRSIPLQPHIPRPHPSVPPPTALCFFPYGLHSIC